VRVRPLYLVVLVLIGGSIFLVYSALAPSINPYLTVSQVRSGAYSEREVQVLATLEDWSVREEGVLMLRLTDGHATLNVTYRGLPPQGLTKGQKIVAIGVLHPPDGLDSRRLLVKCPSKYE
jgi:cytochrome c-type biogenesis protein CcmE